MKSDKDQRGPTISQLIEFVEGYHAFLDTHCGHISKDPKFVKRLHRMRRALGNNSLLDTVRGSGTRANEVGNRLVAQMQRVIDQYRELLKLAQEEERIIVKLAMHPVLAVRILSHFTQSDINVVVGSSSEILDFLRTDPDLHLALVFCSPDQDFAEERRFTRNAYVAEAELSRCLVVRHDDTLLAKHINDFSRGKFDWDWLADKRFAVLRAGGYAPGFPRERVDRQTRGIPARATVEALAAVRARSADIAFTLVDLLDEDTIEHLWPVNLGEGEPFQKARLCLVRGHAATTDLRATPRVTEISNQLKDFLDGIKVRRRAARRVANDLKDFRFIDHLTYRPYNNTLRQCWARGRVTLQVFSRYTGPGTEQVLLIKGRHQVDELIAVDASRGFTPELSDSQRIFHFTGTIPWLERVTTAMMEKPQIFRGSYEDGHAAFGLKVSINGLRNQKYVIGSWSGIPSYIGSDHVLHVDGCYVISKYRMTLCELNLLKANYKNDLLSH